VSVAPNAVWDWLLTCPAARPCSIAVDTVIVARDQFDRRLDVLGVLAIAVGPAAVRVNR